MQDENEHNKLGKGGIMCSTQACTPCNTKPDPTTDTVKVPPFSGPEASPQDEEGEQRLEEVAAQWRAGTQVEGMQREVEVDAQWRASNQVKLQQEEDLRRREEAALQAKLAAEQAEKQRLEEEARRAAEEERRAAEARREAEAAEQRRRQERVQKFLKEHRFNDGVNGFKKTCMKKKYPIHSAAKRGDAEIVEMLVLEGANASEKDSRGKTAMDIAEKKKFAGVVDVLNVLKDKP